ncbi:MAG: type II toxin-antitoxin system RelE/ParE family toxin [Actinomycetota bacterium]|nr:type II toxin-antitoxin system RelE/ParE family toxin [Actinomycetota bacterium]
MTYEIQLTPPARRALEQGLPEQVAAAAWEFITGALAENPQRVGKPLAGQLSGLWAARRGEYRVVYSITDEVITVTILRIAHRSTAYR